MDDLILEVFQRFQMRNLERANCLNRRGKRFIAATCRTLLSHVLKRRAESAQNLGPIESLPFAVVTETHGLPRVV